MTFIDYCNAFDSLERHTVWEQGSNRNMLNRLRLADDIVLLTHTPQKSRTDGPSLNEEGRKLGLQLNAKKTKVMRNIFADSSAVLLNQTTLEDTDEYVYLGRLINMGSDLKPEIIRRRRAPWAAYNTVKLAVSETKNQMLRAELLKSTVIPALCYGSETWTLTKAMETQLRTKQASIERDMVVDDDAKGCITLTSAPSSKSRMLSNTRITQSTVGPSMMRCLVHLPTRAQTRNYWKGCCGPQKAIAEFEARINQVTK
ncbi:hypothetical protein Aduo_007810 [Ancylostoma duodenale]